MSAEEDSRKARLAAEPKYWSIDLSGHGCPGCARLTTLLREAWWMWGGVSHHKADCPDEMHCRECVLAERINAAIQPPAQPATCPRHPGATLGASGCRICEHDGQPPAQPEPRKSWERSLDGHEPEAPYLQPEPMTREQRKAFIFKRWDGALKQMHDEPRAERWKRIAEEAARSLWDVRAYLKNTDESPGAVEQITDSIERLQSMRSALDSGEELRKSRPLEPNGGGI